MRAHGCCCGGVFFYFWFLVFVEFVLCGGLFEVVCGLHRVFRLGVA